MRCRLTGGVDTARVVSCDEISARLIERRFDKISGNTVSELIVEHERRFKMLDDPFAPESCRREPGHRSESTCQW